jgi:hypothetical protein
MGYTSVWNEALPEATQKEIKAFVEGFIAGNQELAKRLNALQK